MARRRSRGRSAETSDFASSPTFENLSNELLRPVVRLEPSLDPLREVHDLSPELGFDRRAYSFDQEQPFTEEVSRGSVSNSVSAPLTSGVRVEEPSALRVCVRRKDRREVLHALRKTGRGGGKKRRRNETSNIHCK